MRRGSNRRNFLLSGIPLLAAGAKTDLGFHFTDVTASAGIDFHHNSGAFGAKYLPETLGPGCAFIDYDGDGWLDILLVNGTGWPGHNPRPSTLSLYRNNRNGTFTDVTRRAGLAVEMYGMGVAVADYNNDGFPDILITGVGQNRLFQNTGKGTFIDVTNKAGLGGRNGLSTSALWFDYDRDGLLDLFVCNYVQWSPEHDVFCSVDGKSKSYCTPEAYHGSTCWLFRNRGNGTFEDVTAKSGIFDTTSKALGVAMLDYDRDGWPDLLVANDTQPNKLYRNQRNGTFEDVAVQAGVAFSEDGKARAGMGVDAADFDNSGVMGIAITNFDEEMMAIYRPGRNGAFDDVATKTGIGPSSRMRLGFGCAFLRCESGRASGSGGGERAHRRNGSQYHRESRLRAAAAFVSEWREREFSRCRGSGGRRLCRAEGGARAGLWRFRSRWRPRSADHDESRAGVIFTATM